MARMGRGSIQAAMICQHQARTAEQAVTDAIDRRVEGQKRGDDDRAVGVCSFPLANGTF
jgi:hypothetical protein